VAEPCLALDSTPAHQTAPAWSRARQSWQISPADCPSAEFTAIPYFGSASIPMRSALTRADHCMFYFQPRAPLSPNSTAHGSPQSLSPAWDCRGHGTGTIGDHDRNLYAHWRAGQRAAVPPTKQRIARGPRGGAVGNCGGAAAQYQRKTLRAALAATLISGVTANCLFRYVYRAMPSNSTDPSYREWPVPADESIDRALQEIS